jgi:hypothetical protein
MPLGELIAHPARDHVYGNRGFLRDTGCGPVRRNGVASRTPSGYTKRRARPDRDTAALITPPPLIALLHAGWHGVVPFLHPSAQATAH